MPDLPCGTVTFLFTDIEGSTERWEQDLAAMAVAGSPASMIGTEQSPTAP